MNCPNDQLSAKHYRFNKMEKEGVIYWLKPRRRIEKSADL